MEDTEYPQGCQETSIRLPKREIDDLDDVKPTLTLNMKDTNRKSSKTSSTKKHENSKYLHFYLISSQMTHNVLSTFV